MSRVDYPIKIIFVLFGYYMAFKKTSRLYISIVSSILVCHLISSSALPVFIT